MKTIGVIFTVLLGLFVLVGLVVGVRSVPDIRRYFKMRSM